MKYLKDKKLGTYHFELWKDGKRYHRRGFDSLQSAKDAHFKLLKELNSGVLNGEITVEAWIEYYFPIHIKKKNLQKRSIMSIEGSIKHINEFLGNKKVSKLTAGDVDDLVVNMIHKGLALGSIQRHFKTLSMFLKEAVKRQHAIFNVCTQTDCPKPPTKTTKQRIDQVYTTAEQTKIRKEAHKDVFDPSPLNRSTEFMRRQRRLYIELLIATGLRRSEALALKFTDVVPTTEKREGKFVYMLHVQRSQDYDVTIKTTKNGEDRRIPLSPELIEMINDHKKFLDEYAEYYDFNNQGFMLPSDTGDMYASRNMSNTITEFLRRIGMKGGSHTFRHTAITNWLQSTKDFKLAQTLAGHKTMSLTVDLYGHVLEDNVIDSLDAIYLVNRNTSPQ